MSRTPPRRSLETQGAGNVPAVLKKLAKEFYFSNKEANAAKKLADTARKSLFSGMKELGLKMFTTRVSTGRSTIALTSEIGTGRSTTEIDLAKLRKLVKDDEKLWGVVGISKKDIVDTFGTAVADQVCKSVDGKENVNVGPKK